MLLLGLKPKNHVLDQKKYIRQLELKNKFELGIKKDWQLTDEESLSLNGPLGQTDMNNNIVDSMCTAVIK